MDLRAPDALVADCADEPTDAFVADVWARPPHDFPVLCVLRLFDDVIATPQGNDSDTFRRGLPTSFIAELPILDDLRLGGVVIMMLSANAERHWLDILRFVAVHRPGSFSMVNRCRKSNPLHSPTSSSSEQSTPRTIELDFRCKNTCPRCRNSSGTSARRANTHGSSATVQLAVTRPSSTPRSEPV